MIKALYQTSDGKIFETKHEAEEYESKRQYFVTYNFIGSICVPVQAKNKEEAKRLADDEWYTDEIDWEITNVEVEEC